MYWIVPILNHGCKWVFKLSSSLKYRFLLFHWHPWVEVKQLVPWACQLVVVVELACLSDFKIYAGGDLVPGGFNRAGLVEG